MGLWGAAQALAFGLGGLLGTGASDLARAAFGGPALAYAAVFAARRCCSSSRPGWQAACSRAPHPSAGPASGAAATA